PGERRGARQGGSELADDLLDDVLDRHQSHQLAVLVDHQRESLVVLLEVLDLRQRRRRRRHEVGLVEQRLERLLVELGGASTRRRCSTPATSPSALRNTGRRMWYAVPSWWTMVSIGSSSLTESIFARGTMMSCTVTASMSNRLSTIARCFFGMKVEDSSTRVRISSGESFGASVDCPGLMPTRRSSGRAKRLMNQAGMS